MKRSIKISALLASTILLAAPLAMAQTKLLKQQPDKHGSLTTNNPLLKADGDMKTVIDAQGALGAKPIDKLTPEEARKQPTVTDAVKKILEVKGESAAPDPSVTTKELSYTTGGTKQTARVYVPSDAVSGKPMPVIVYYHGGGWVIADINVYDSTPRAIAKQTGAIVVSAEYRHAPESKFPAQHEDALAAYQWTLKNAASWGGDPKRVAVMGESAGGNLAINTAIAARDKGLQKPIYEVLIYPVAGVDMNTPSYKENENAKPLNKAMMGWFVKNTIKSDADKQDARLDVIGKADVSGLPPTTIITAEIDPLRSDGEMLAEKLEKAGVKVNLKNYGGVTHEFFGTAKVVDAAKEAQEVVSTDLKGAFGEK